MKIKKIIIKIEIKTIYIYFAFFNNNFFSNIYYILLNIQSTKLSHNF